MPPAPEQNSDDAHVQSTALLPDLDPRAKEHHGVAVVGRNPKDRRQRLWALQARGAPYLFLLPFFILFVGFMLYPLGRSLILSFQKTSGAGRAYGVGWENYSFLVRDKL